VVVVVVVVCVRTMCEERVWKGLRNVRYFLLLFFVAFASGKTKSSWVLDFEESASCRVHF
jgi:hypothetical protein